MKNRWNLSLTLAAALAGFITVEMIAGGQAPAPQGAPGARGAGAGPRAGGGGGGQRGPGGGGGGGQRAGGQRAPATPAGPTPRLPNGKPDLSGHWNNPYTSNMATANNLRDAATGERLTFARQGEAFPNAPHGGSGAKSFDLPYTEWGLKSWLNYDPIKNGDYTGSCLPFGMSRSINAPRGLQITHGVDSVALMFEQNTWFHWVPTTEFKWPADLEQWNGVSLGKWDGDTLVIETTSFNGYTRLDTAGHPHSKGLKLTNKLLRTDARTIQHTVIVHDPKTYTKDWMNVRTWTIQAPDSYIMEYACEENNGGILDGSITPWKRPADEDLD